MKTIDFEPLDETGYPTPELLDFIRTYDPDRSIPLVEFIELLRYAWAHNSYGFDLRNTWGGKRTLYLHTGGWSGNEEIVEALLDNKMLTTLWIHYVRWDTGGHFKFRIRGMR